MCDVRMYSLPTHHHYVCIVQMHAYIYIHIHIYVDSTPTWLAISSQRHWNMPAFIECAADQRQHLTLIVFGWQTFEASLHIGKATRFDETTAFEIFLESSFLGLATVVTYSAPGWNSTYIFRELFFLVRSPSLFRRRQVYLYFVRERTYINYRDFSSLESEPPVSPRLFDVRYHSR